jgi:hypothetical protein
MAANFQSFVSSATSFSSLIFLVMNRNSFKMVRHEFHWRPLGEQQQQLPSSSYCSRLELVLLLSTNRLIPNAGTVAGESESSNDAAF